MKKRWMIIGVLMCVMCLGKLPSFSMLHAESVDDGLVVDGWEKDQNGTFTNTVPYTGVEKIKLYVTVNDGYVISNAYDDPAYQGSNNVAIMNKNLDVWIIAPGKKGLYIETKDTNGTMTKHRLQLTVEGIGAEYDNLAVIEGAFIPLTFFSSEPGFQNSTANITGNTADLDVLTYDPNSKKLSAIKCGQADFNYTYENYHGLISVNILEKKPSADEYSFEGMNVSFALNSPLNSRGTMIGRLKGPGNVDYYSIKNGDGSKQTALTKVLPDSLGNYIRLSEPLPVGTHTFQISLSGGTFVSGSATIPFTIIVTAPTPAQDWLNLSGTINDAGWFQENVTLTPSSIAQEYGFTKLSIDDTNYSESVIFDTEGTTNQKIVFQNDKGDVTPAIYKTIRIDKANPVIVSAAYDQATKKVSISGTDSTSGIVSYVITVKDTKTNTTIVDSYELKGSDITKSDQGYQASYTPPSDHDDMLIEITAKDKSGRSSEVKTVTISSTPDVAEPTPVASWISTDVSVNADTGWFTSYPALSLSKAAKDAGYTKLKLSTETDSTETLTLNSDTKDGIDLVFTNDDQSKVSESLHMAYKIDTTKPTTGVIELAKDPSLQSTESKRIHITADDVTSGLSQVAYTIKDEHGTILQAKTEVNFSATSKEVYVPSLDNQIFQVEAIVYDQAGNQTAFTPVTLSTKEQGVPDEPTKDTPTASWLSIDQIPVNGWYSSAITLTVSDAAKALGYTTLGTTTMDTSLSLSSEGANNVSIIFEKADGTKSNALSFHADIDTADPAITDIQLVNKGESLLHYMTFGLFDTKQVIQIQADDETSGVKEIQYSIQNIDTNEWMVSSQTEQAVDGMIELASTNDVNMKVCAKATDQAGHTTPNEACETISTKAVEEQGTSIKDSITGIELYTSKALFDQDDVLEVSEVQEVKEALTTQLNKDHQKLVKGYRLTWMRNGQSQQLKDPVELKLPAKMLKDVHLYLEQADGTYQRIENPETDTILISTLNEFILTQDDTQVNPDPTPTPNPDPNPDPNPNPTPNPDPKPDPNPEPTPTPNPNPDPTPNPNPKPEPTPNPNPTPTPTPNPDPSPAPVSELQHKSTGWKLKVDEEQIFTTESKFTIIDQTETSTELQKQTLKRFIKGDYEPKKIQSVEVTGLKATPQAYHLFIPAEIGSKALYLIPKEDGYVQKVLRETNGYYEIETSTLGLFVELQATTKDPLIEPTNPDPSDNQGTSTTTPTNPSSAIKQNTNEQSSIQKETSTGAKTSDYSHQTWYYILLCSSISLLFVVNRYQKHHFHVTKRDI